MIEAYTFNPSSDEMSIRCPACGAEAIFKFAFSPLSGFTGPPGIGRLPRNPKAYRTDKGEFDALVNYPDLVPWVSTDRSIGYHINQSGVCTCPTCGCRKAHKLNWPEEAYLACEIKGERLWAWDREYLKALIDYIASKNRKPERYENVYFLRHIPTTFLLARNRDEVVRKLRRLLEPRPT